MDERDEHIIKSSIRWKAFEIIRYYRGRFYRAGKREHAKKAVELAEKVFQELDKDLEKAKILIIQAEDEWKQAGGKPL